MEKNKSKTAQLSKFILIIICLTLVFRADAQNITLRGRVLANTKSLESVTVSVSDSQRSQLLKTVLTDSLGNWQIDMARPGAYTLLFTRVGFTSQKITIQLTETGKIVDSIELLLADKNYNAVTVASKKPMIEVKAGKIIVNVDATTSNAGATVLDVLEKSPGITVDRDGNISLKGKLGVVVMIDKRPTYLSAQDLVNMLRSMPSNLLDQIEIISQPGSSFDAAGNSGVINLKLKKNKARGSNGSVTAGLTQGFYLRNNQGFNLNYKNKKINVFTNVNHDYNRRVQELELERKFIEPINRTPLSRFFQKANQSRHNDYKSAKAGLDYELDSSNVFGFVAELNIAKGGEDWSNESDIFNSKNEFQNRSTNKQLTSYKNKNMSLNINWRKTISKSAFLFTNLDMISYDNLRTQDLNTLNFDSNGQYTGINTIQKGNLPSDIKIYLAKVDFEKTFKKGQRLEAGIKASFVQTKNDAGYYLFENNNWVVDNLRTNKFAYNENINAAYFSYAFSKGKKWEFNMGLRAEQTISKGFQKINDSSFVRNYFNVFPTLFANFKINEKQSLSLNFGRRIQRPDYQDLNPFRFYLDQYTYQVGNVFLQPHFTYSTEVNYSMMNGVLNHTLGYSFTNDAITDILEQNEQTNETFVSKRNVATKRNINYAISYNAPINKWYTTSIYAETNLGTISGNLNGSQEKINTKNYIINVNNQFKLSEKWKAEIGGFYRPKGNEDLIIISPVVAVNAGFSKTMLKGKGSLRISFRDIFNSQQFTAIIKYGSVNTRIKQWNDRQTMGLSFTYRFNKGIKIQTAKNKASRDEEINRVK